MKKIAEDYDSDITELESGKSADWQQFIEQSKEKIFTKEKSIYSSKDLLAKQYKQLHDFIHQIEDNYVVKKLYNAQMLFGQSEFSTRVSYSVTTLVEFFLA